METAVPAALAAVGVPRVVVGLSGGADSVALAAALAWATRHRRGPLAGVPVEARVVDHGLQPGSGDVARTARDQAVALGLTASVIPVTVTATGEGLEAAARAARYAALLTDDPSVVALGHTLDDQAETVLLGLARGSGLRSLAGMAPQVGRIVRPLLGLRRDTTTAACRDWGLTWWDDPTNADPMYARSRLRAAMGTLEDLLGPGLALALARTAALARTDADYLDQALTTTAPDLDATADAVPADALAALPIALRGRFLLAWLRPLGGDQAGYDAVHAVDALVTNWHGQGPISVPGGTVTRVGGHLRRTPSTVK